MIIALLIIALAIITQYNKKLYTMSVVSKAALTTQIASDLASASNITAAEHRGVAQNIVDSYENVVVSYTTAQIAALAGMTLRQRVFNTTDNDYEWYDGTRWVKEAHPKYKVYRALITQSGTSAPTAVVLENTLGGTVVWSYDSVGNYTGTLAGAFSGAGVVALCQSIVTSSPMRYIQLYSPGADTINITTLDDTFTPANDVLNSSTSIEIQVYY